jgi:hypothetical protein
MPLLHRLGPSTKFLVLDLIAQIMVIGPSDFLFEKVMRNLDVLESEFKTIDVFS